MATQYTATQLRTAWDAAMTAYAALRGGTVDDVMNSAVDMQSVDDAGPWDLVDEAAFNGLNPNNRVQVAFTDGTDVLVFNYDELDNYTSAGFIAKMDSYFGPHFKTWMVLAAIKVAVEKAGIGGTFTMPDPAALWEWDDYQLLINDLAGKDGRPEFSGLVSGIDSDANGADAVFPAPLS